MVHVIVKWQKETFDVELDPSLGVPVFKSQLYSLTGVPPDRQKVSGVKGGFLKDDSNLAALGFTDGQKLLLIGTAEPAAAVLAEPAVSAAEEEIDAEDAVVVPNSFPAGLKNLGNTCYLNASLQCLRAVTDLRSAVINARKQNPSASDVTKQLSGLFSDMDSTKEESLMPLAFLSAFQRAFPQFSQRSQANSLVYAQQDAEEALTQLMHTLSQDLSSSVTDSFGGELDVEVKCVENPDEVTCSTEPFHKLQCHITNQVNDVLSGLKSSMTEEIEKRSSTLNRDATFLKSSKISRLPPFLVIQFVRFFWRRDINGKAKILRVVEFPDVLDVYNLCSPALQSELSSHRRITTESQVMQGEGIASSPSKDGKYELRAVLTHKGRTADSGHYVAWVKDVENNRWLLFDDDKVSVVPASDIKKLSGGGDWHTAYVCFYGPRSV
eukprot:ANDGO_08513.mRNA.1 Ubiquitin carboxyl-terminal hydrolase 6